MVEKEQKYSINVTFDQHEAIINMKRGKDTVYDVIDRLISLPKRVKELEKRIDSLGDSLLACRNAAHQLRKEMKNV